jgi:excisionase family DNA binding protein
MVETETVTVREVAVRAGCTLTYVYNLVRAERLPGAHKQDGTWRVPKVALDAYLKRRGGRASRATAVSDEAKAA